MSWKNVTAECGCVIEMNLSHDWESGVTDAEDVSIISACKAHSPTPRAADGDCPYCQYPSFDESGKLLDHCAACSRPRR